MLDLWRRRLNFLLWRRGRLLFRNRFRSGHRLAMGGAGVGLGAEISCGAAFTSGVGFGGVRFAGPPCELGVGVVSGFFS